MSFGLFVFRFSSSNLSFRYPSLLFPGPATSLSIFSFSPPAVILKFYLGLSSPIANTNEMFKTLYLDVWDFRFLCYPSGYCFSTLGLVAFLASSICYVTVLSHWYLEVWLMISMGSVENIMQPKVEHLELAEIIEFWAEISRTMLVVVVSKPPKKGICFKLSWLLPALFFLQ